MKSAREALHAAWYPSGGVYGWNSMCVVCFLNGLNGLNEWIELNGMERISGIPNANANASLPTLDETKEKLHKLERVPALVPTHHRSVCLRLLIGEPVPPTDEKGTGEGHGDEDEGRRRSGAFTERA